MRNLLNKIFGHPVYLRFNRECFSIRDISTGNNVKFRPVVGIKGAENKREIASVGDPVSADAKFVVNPFDHPRIAIHDFTIAEQLCSHAFRELFKGDFLRSAPTVVVHPDTNFEGGFTQIEARAVREMVEGAGARRVFLHYGDVLSDKGVMQLASGKTAES